MAAVSLWLGWPGLVGYCLVVAVAGGVLAAAVLVFRRLTLPAVWAARPWLARLHRADEGLPYGVALGVGGLVFLRPAVASVLGG
jgi:prepilin peptidase CpaA